LSLICRNILQQGTAISTAKRFALVMTFQAVGRSGEVALTNMDNESASWDEDSECLILDWSEVKTTRQKTINFFCDYSNFELDFYHAFACYLCCGGGLMFPGNSKIDVQTNCWLFPNLRSNHTSAASVITEYIREGVRESNGSNRQYTDKVSGTSLRIGATNFMAHHPTTDIMQCILRGGWDFTGMTNFFEYILHTNYGLSVGGRALAGWPDSRQACYPPRMDKIFETMKDEEMSKFKNLIHELVPFHWNEKNSCPSLLKLRETLCASLFQHYDQMLAVCTTSHPVIDRIDKAILRFKYSAMEMKKWSETITIDWNIRNSIRQNVDNRNGMAVSVTMMSEQVHRLEVENHMLISRIDGLEKVIKANERDITELLNMTRGLTKLLHEKEVSTPSPKRAKISQSTSLTPTIDVEPSIQFSNEPLVDIVSLQSSNEPQNAFMLMKQASEVSEINKFNASNVSKMTISQIFIAWFKHDLRHESNYCETIEKRDIKRVSTVMNVLLSFFKEEEKQESFFWMNKKPSVDSVHYQKWNNELQSVAVAAADKMKLYLMDKQTGKGLVQHDENRLSSKPRAKKDTVGSIERRLSALKKA
jgi:hypothetical protein